MKLVYKVIREEKVLLVFLEIWVRLVLLDLKVIEVMRVF